VVQGTQGFGQVEEHNILPFRDRAEAGRLLGSALAAYAGRLDVLVLALPRGGIPVACEVAKALAAPLDVFVVRKLGAPGNPELAIGAVAPGGICILQEEIIAGLEISAEIVVGIAAREEQVRRESEELYRRHLPPQNIASATVVLVDDGVATGATMRAAISALRHLQANRVVVAAPVAPAVTRRDLRAFADEVICLATPEVFFTVGQWYINFEQVGEQEITALLEQTPPSYNFV
jgi:putative phosphoribosyl transferase